MRGANGAVFSGQRHQKKRAILLSVCGSKTYTLIRDLLQPRKPADTRLEDILKEVGKHYSPKPSEIATRFKFHNWRQVGGKIVSEFIVDCESSLKIVTLERHWMIGCGTDWSAESIAGRTWPEIQTRSGTSPCIRVSVQKHVRLEYPSEGRNGAGIPREQPSVEMLSLRR